MDTIETTTNPTGGTEGLGDFISNMQRPREQIDAPQFEIEDAEIEGEEGDDGGDAGAGDDLGSEYQNEALMAILLIDSGVGILGTVISGLPADRYQKFTERKPPKHYLNATAALIEKYSLQGALSPEMVFLIALVSVYSGSVSKAMSDRAAVVKKAKQEAAQQEKERMRAEVLAAKEAR